MTSASGLRFVARGATSQGAAPVSEPLFVGNRRDARGFRLRMGIATAVMLLAAAGTAAQTSLPAVKLVEPVSILVLSSYSADTPYSMRQMTGIRNGLRNHQRTGHALHFEFLDIDRRPSRQIETRLLELLREKYATSPPKVVITLDTPALLFIDRHLESVAPGASIVFCAATDVPDGLSSRHPATGIIERIDIGGAVRMIGQLLPELERLVVVTSPSGFAAGLRDLAKETLAGDPPPFSVEHIVEPSRRVLKDRVAGLGPNTAILLLAHDQLTPDPLPSADDPLKDFCQTAAAPVFGLFDTMLDHGVVGGRMTSGLRQGEKAGEYAARIAAGESASSLPIERELSVASLFDGRELKRWRIDRSRLPIGSLVQIEPDSIWSTRRREITAVAIGLTALQAIIIWQLVRHRRRSRESEDRYRDLVELCPDAILVHDGVHFSFANPAAVAMLGAKDLSDLSARPVSEIVAPESREALRRRFRMVLDEQLPAPPADAKLIRLDKRPITVEATGRPCIFAGRRHIQVMLRDVTERRRFDLQMQNLQKMETIGLLAGGVAHDFNNILTAMRISVEEARRALGHAPDVAERLLVVVSDAVDRAANLVRQLLAIGGRDVPTPASAVLDAAILAARPLIDRILGPNVTAEYDLHAGGAMVAIDVGRIEQIIVNFAANAADAMDRRGRFAIRTRSLELSEEEAALFRGQPGTYSEIEVRDSGSGIAAEHLPRVFEPFFTTKSSDRGTGLGLATVYGIARRAGGTATVESRPGDGAIFRVLLPSATPVAEQPAAPPALPVGEDILVVDDEPQIRTLAAELLRSAGYRPHLAADCAGALEIAKSTPLAAAVLDVRLGTERGDALAADLRRIHAELPILFITGYATEEELERLRGFDWATCLAKPFVPDELLAAVSDAASRGPATVSRR